MRPHHPARADAEHEESTRAGKTGDIVADGEKGRLNFLFAEKGIELVFDKVRQAQTGLRFDLGEEGIELFQGRLIQGRFLGTSPLEIDSVIPLSAGDDR